MGEGSEGKTSRNRDVVVSLGLDGGPAWVLVGGGAAKPLKERGGRCGRSPGTTGHCESVSASVSTRRSRHGARVPARTFFPSVASVRHGHHNTTVAVRLTGRCSPGVSDRTGNVNVDPFLCLLLPLGVHGRPVCSSISGPSGTNVHTRSEVGVRTGSDLWMIHGTPVVIVS